MISRKRMKFDLIGQIVLILAIIIQAIWISDLIWPKAFLFILIAWQLLSAIHLLFAYRYFSKSNFLWTSLILLVSLPIWIKLIGLAAYLPVAGLGIWYFWQTIRDTIIVLNRPRSFWELF